MNTCCIYVYTHICMCIHIYIYVCMCTGSRASKKGGPILHGGSGPPDALPGGPGSGPDSPETRHGTPGGFRRPRRAPQNGPDGADIAQDRPNTSNTRPTRPPRKPPEASRQPQEAKIIHFDWFVLGFWLSRLFELPTLHEGRRDPRDRPKTAEEDPERAPRQPKELPDCPTGAQDGPRAPQDRPKVAPREAPTGAL